MNASGWDAAAARTLCEAKSLFSATDLSWVDALPWTDDPWAAFERLIGAALATGVREAVPPAAATAGAPRLAPETIGPLPSPMGLTRPGWREIPARPLTPPVGLAPMPRAAAGQSLGRAARLAALPLRSAAAPLPAGPTASMLGTPFGRVEPPRAENRAAETVASLTPPPAGSAPLPHPTTPTPATRTPRSLDTPRGPAAANYAVAPSQRPMIRPVEPAMPSEGPDQPVREETTRPTRLVDGLPALHGLLQAAVAQSRERHARPAVEPAPPSPSVILPPPPAPLLVAAPPLRALPQLDAVAEDILVDRLIDRLQERLREQALRQFGFTGGLA